MATSAEAVERTARAAGRAFPFVTVERTARVLREARQDLWPLSGKGGGKNAQHVEPRHLANLIMALASPQPIGAAEAVATIRPLRYASRVVVYRHPAQAEGAPTQLVGQVEDRRGPDKENFGETLERMIAEGADPARRAAWATHRSNVEFSMCVVPALAEISWPTSDGIWTDHYLPAERDLPFTFAWLPKPKLPGRQVLILPYEMIVAAGELWEHTLSQRGVASARASPRPTADKRHGEGNGDEQ